MPIPCRGHASWRQERAGECATKISDAFCSLGKYQTAAIRLPRCFLDRRLDAFSDFTLSLLHVFFTTLSSVDRTRILASSGGIFKLHEHVVNSNDGDKLPGQNGQCIPRQSSLPKEAKKKTRREFKDSACALAKPFRKTEPLGVKVKRGVQRL